MTVSDALPAGTTYYSSRPSQGTCSGTTTVSCALGAVDSTATVTIVVIPSEAGSVTNTATVSANEEHPNTDNNTSSATTTVSSPTRVETLEVLKSVPTYIDVPSLIAASAKAPSGAENQCKSARAQVIHWRLAPGVQLERVVITRNAQPYQTLAGSARKTTVDMAGLAKGT